MKKGEALCQSIIDKVEEIKKCKDDAKLSLISICTTPDMDTQGDTFDLLDEQGNSVLDNMELWPDLIAMRQNADGDAYLNIDVNGDMPVFKGKNGNPSNEYLIENGRVKSIVPYEERSWLTMGWSETPAIFAGMFGNSMEFLTMLRKKQSAGKLASLENIIAGYETMLVFPSLFRQNWVGEKESGYEKNVDTSGVTNWNGAFMGASLLQMPDELDTSSAKSVKYMFKNCSSITKLPKMNLSSVETFCDDVPVLNVLNNGNFLSGCVSLVDISGISGIGETENVYAGFAHSLFSGLRNAEILPAVDFRNAALFTDTFSGCAIIKDLSGMKNIGTRYIADTESRVLDTNMNGMFNGCRLLARLPEITYANCRSLSTTFYNCTSLVSVEMDDLSNIGTNSRTPEEVGNDHNSMNNCFNSCTSLKTVRIGRFPLLDVKCNNIFKGCTSLESIVCTERVNPYVLRLMLDTIPTNRNGDSTLEVKLPIDEQGKVEGSTEYSTIVALCRQKNIEIEYE